MEITYKHKGESYYDTYADNILIGTVWQQKGRWFATTRDGTVLGYRRLGRNGYITRELAAQMLIDKKGEA